MLEKQSVLMCTFYWVEIIYKGILNQVPVLVSEVRTRSKRYKWDEIRIIKETGKTRCTSRVVVEWNKMNRHVVKAIVTESFKWISSVFMGRYEY